MTRMQEHDWLAQQFEENRSRLQAVAYRMLGSQSEADDAVQEAWLRCSGADVASVRNLGGWLTTIVARVCLDMLRSRTRRREQPLDGLFPDPPDSREAGADPEYEALLADSLGLALLVVLDTLAPPERVAFVLHDMFAVPFDEIAPIVGRSPDAARQLASRARRRVQGAPADPDADLTGQRAVIEAFIAASREGDFEALLAVLDPNVVLRADATAAPGGASREVRGAAAVSARAHAYRRGARFAQPVLVNGAIGAVVAPHGRLALVIAMKIADQRIAEIEIIADRDRLGQLDLAVLDD